MRPNKLPTLAYKGTYSYTNAGGEQTVLEVLNANANLLKFNGIWLDLVNMTQNGTIKVYYKIDGTNYRVFNTNSWTTADDDGVLIDLESIISGSFKVTYTEAVDEGADRAIPYDVTFEVVK